ncbi:hypothetical protein MHF_0628 [Mycoplasma haemofelis Ohio2]|uniref:Uncharacterized protein n=1 Tax=Mycoplasma haemofelis (strain Ohio2) TaxID=859194 RepID=F6FI52_MYCHI|nr:hypothetical protein MHF_0628 [Mycoplasma haemofelis Ohio2]
MKLKLLGLSAIGASGTGGWYLFGNIRPKNVEEYLTRSGLKLLAWDSEYSWKAVLEENKELLKNILKKDPDSQSIKQWCRDILPREDYEKYAKAASLVCVDNPQTVKGKIIQLDGGISSLIEGLSDGDKVEKYKVSYVWKKHMSAAMELISFTPPEEEEGLERGGKALGDWCKKALQEKPNDTLVSNVKLLCSPMPFDDINGLITKNGESSKLMSDYQSKYDSIKELDTFKNDESVKSIKDKSDKSDKEILQKWCEESKSKKFSEKGTFSERYPKFRFRCLQGSEGEKK